MNKHKSNKIKENSNTVRHLIMGQIITTQNLVAIKEVRHAGQWTCQSIIVIAIDLFTSEDRYFLWIAAVSLFTIPTTFRNAHALCYTREAPLIQSATKSDHRYSTAQSMLWLFREARTSPIIVFAPIPTCSAGTNSIAIDLITVKDRFFFSASATSPGPPATIRSPFLLVVIRWLHNDFSIPRAPENMSHENIH